MMVKCVMLQAVRESTQLKCNQQKLEQATQDVDVSLVSVQFVFADAVPFYCLQTYSKYPRSTLVSQLKLKQLK